MSNLKDEIEQRRKLYKETRTANAVSDVPEDEHFAVLVNESFSYNDAYGDHSYSTHNYLNYIYFDSTDALKDWISQNQNKNKSFRVINVKPVEIKTEVIVNVITK